MRLKQYFLIFASFAVTVIGLLYGISPQWFARTFFGISEIDLNIAHILRAIILNPAVEKTKMATITPLPELVGLYFRVLVG